MTKKEIYYSYSAANSRCNELRKNIRIFVDMYREHNKWILKIQYV